VKKGLIPNVVCASTLLLALLPQGSKAQTILTTPVNVTLNASLAESLSVSLTGLSTVSFTLVPGGIATGSGPVGIQTSWVLKPGKTTVTLVGFFDTTDALTDGATGANIASANVLGQVNGSGGYTAFTQTVSGIGTAGASLQLFSESITGTNKNKTRTDSLDLEIDLTPVPQQPAGDYTGTLRIQAIAL
jgi:hypothetical protein